MHQAQNSQQSSLLVFACPNRYRFPTQKVLLAETVTHHPPPPGSIRFSYISRGVTDLLCGPSLLILRLNISFQDAEEFLSNLVASQVVFARIDRPGGTISFQPHKEPNEILNEWSHNINSLMQLLNKTNHLITKEEMVHGLAS